MLPLYLLLGATILSAASLIYRGWRNGVTPVPSSPRATRTMVAAVGEELHRIAQREGRDLHTMRIVEAGSGWGGPALRLARRLPEARLIGYENSPIPHLVSRLRAWIGGDVNVLFLKRDFESAELPRADLILCYLYPAGMRSLDRLIGGAAAAGSGPTVVSNTFTIPGRTADRSLPSGDFHLSTIYVYRYTR